MKTKELIEILQKEDPSGEAHIRIEGGIIRGVDVKPGYWDGHYSYLEEGDDGKPIWIESTKNYKVDFLTMDLYDFAAKFKGNWEEVKKHIRVEYTYLDEGEREREFIEHAKKECDEYNEVMEKVKRLHKK